MIKKMNVLYLLFFCLLFSTGIKGVSDDVSLDVKPKMRILFIVDKFPWWTKVIILNQAVGLIKLGHDVSIFAQQGVKSDKLDPEVFEYNLLEKTYYGEFPPDIHTYDIIVCQYGDLGKQFAHIKKTLHLKAKLVTFFRGAEVTSPRHIMPHEYDDLFENGDLFFPICDYFKYRLILLGCDPKKIKVHYSPVNCERFSYRKNIYKKNRMVNVTTVARLSEEKGLQYCIRALARFINKNPNVVYTIVGDGPDRAQLQSEIDGLGMQNKIILKGWMTHSELIHVLNESHIFLLPSVIPKKGSLEAIPNALKEAMLVGLPVIATYHGGNAELIKDGVNGFLIPERDEYAIELKLNYLIKHPKVWETVGRRAQEDVQRMFDVEHLIKKLEATFYDLLGW